MKIEYVIVIICAVIILFEVAFLVYLFLKKKKSEKDFRTESQTDLHPTLLNYVKEQRSQGYDKKTIRDKLLETGWEKSIVDSVMNNS